MTRSNSALVDATEVVVQHIKPSRTVATLEEDVLEGLGARPRELHPKYFYDERGSELFDAICDTPEYYLTRTEWDLLEQHAAEIIERASPVNVLELGSGTSRKSRLLLDAWDASGGIYWPFDVSEEMLARVAGELTEEYPGLSIHGLVGDYTAGFGNFPSVPGKTLAMFLGSTLGNFAPEFAREFLIDFSSHLNAGDYFLLGADLHKDTALLEAAYNDAAGVTAEFNLNVLRVMNERLDADFSLPDFEHRAVYNEKLRRIEMYLISTRSQTVRVGSLDREFLFDSGERILTEISRKFLPEDLESLLTGAGFTVEQRFIAQERPYALMLGKKTA